MSVIFLTSRSDVAEPIADGKALLLTKEALNPTTMQAVYRNEPWDHIKDPCIHPQLPTATDKGFT